MSCYTMRLLLFFFFFFAYTTDEKLVLCCGMDVYIFALRDFLKV